MLEDFRLKVFMAVSEEGNFTRAARALGISQPAVSQNIAELEKELGKELFVRTKGSVTLTPAGSSFKEFATKILHWYSVADDMFGPAGKLKSPKPVTIAADSYAATSILPRILNNVLSVNFGLSFKVVPEVTTDKPDLLFTCRAHKAELSIEEGNTFVRSFPAVAITDDKGTSSPWAITSGVRFAVWTPYVPFLPLDFASKVVVDSYSIPSLMNMSSSGLVVIIPKESAYLGIGKLDINLSFLDMDLYAIPSPVFAKSEVYRLLRNILKEDL